MATVVAHCVEAALVHFIQDNHTVLGQRRISQDLPQQTAVSHVLHHGVLAHRHTRVGIGGGLWFSTKRERKKEGGFV